MPFGTYNPLESTLSALRSRTLLRHPVVIAASLKVSPNAIRTWCCSTIAVFGSSPMTPLSHMIPRSVPPMPKRPEVLFRLLAPVTQPTQVVGWVATAASGVEAEASATAWSDSRREPQPSRPITSAPMPVGAVGALAAVVSKRSAPSTLVTSFCTPVATALTAAPSDGLAFATLLLRCHGQRRGDRQNCGVVATGTAVPVATTGFDCLQ